MEIKFREFGAFVVCHNCGECIRDVFVLDIGEEIGAHKQTWLCFSCILKLRDLCHEATCEKDVTGKCDCWEGER